jgi:uncharacterized coiled-coil DUF342 family protein
MESEIADVAEDRDSLAAELGELRDQLAEARKVLRKTYGCIGTLRRMADSPAREQYAELQQEINAASSEPPQ